MGSFPQVKGECLLEIDDVAAAVRESRPPRVTLAERREQPGARRHGDGGDEVRPWLRKRLLRGVAANRSG